MPSSDSPFKWMFRFQQPAFGTSLTAISSPFTILHDDATLATSTPYDPYALLAGTSTNHAKCRRIVVPDEYSYAEISHVYFTPTSGGVALSAKPSVRLFGLSPQFTTDAGKRKWPQDVLGTQFPDLAAASGATGIWELLVPPDYTPGAPDIQLTGVGTQITCTTPIAGTLVFSERRTFYLSGATDIILSVVSATTFTGGTGYSLIGVRFTA